ncbi:PMEI domain-containing protein [Psidium guajava]|nr:PMEI domain-containing protein [Psidium guajava]
MSQQLPLDLAFSLSYGFPPSSTAKWRRRWSSRTQSKTKERLAAVERLSQLLEASTKSLSASETACLVDCCLDLLKDNKVMASATVVSGDRPRKKEKKNKPQIENTFKFF